MTTARLLARVVAVLALVSCSSQTPSTHDTSVPPGPTQAPPADVPPSAQSLHLSVSEGATPVACKPPDAGALDCPDAEVLRGEPFFVTVTFRHQGTANGTLLERPDGLDFDLEVLGPDGVPRPRTRYGEQRLARRATTPAVARSIAPAEEMTTRLFATRIVDLSEHGIYRLQVVRSTPEGTVESNELRIDIHNVRGPQ